MKDTVLHPVHPSVHRDASPTVGARRACTAPRNLFGRGKNTVLGWNDPDFDALPRPRDLRGRSSPVFCPRVFPQTVARSQETGPSGAKFLGHSTIEMTADIYPHTSAEAEREAAIAPERAIYGDLFPVVPNFENGNNSAALN